MGSGGMILAMGIIFKATPVTRISFKSETPSQLPCTIDHLTTKRLT
jgi:hypothetical protein